ncbi:class I SAM-dependent methyltransferase [Micromonospora sp. NPDC050397]|uniref:class I SAM-dependent methyltransferase n=1 Tax=Micromonospora sp. NPDC050397 TaxID=3364279 RepID=UPI00384C61BF
MSTTETDGVPYALDNDEVTAGSVLDYLAKIWDPFTQTRLRAAGLTKGTTAWVAAAGKGTIAHWLAAQGAWVTATDVNPKHIDPHAQISILTRNDELEPAPRPGFGLIHARCALAHWPTREAVVKKMEQALIPGGALVIEDWGDWSGWVLTSPVPDAAGIYARYQAALLEVFRAAGNDPTWAGRTADAMTTAGLEDVSVATRAESWRGGTAGCMLPVAVARELRDKLLAVGATAEDLDALPDVMTNRGTLLLGNMSFSTIGYRPEL